MPTTTTAPTATKTTAVTSNGKGRQAAKTTARAEQRLLLSLRNLAGGGTRGRQARARIHGNQSRPCYHRLLG